MMEKPETRSEWPVPSSEISFDCELSSEIELRILSLFFYFVDGLAKNGEANMEEMKGFVTLRGLSSDSTGDSFLLCLGL